MPRLRRPRSPVRLLRQVAAAGLACLALVLALRPPATTTVAPTAGPTVVVAAADLPAGRVLTTEDVRPVQLPADRAPDGASTDSAELAGRVLAAPLRAGEPITDVRLVGPGLWAAVPDGQVAAPVRLADLAVTTLLRAGDRVDVLAAAGEAAAPSVELVASGALVLTAPAPDGGTAAGDAGLLVLAVPPDTAAALAAAAATGSLTVTLGRP